MLDLGWSEMALVVFLALIILGPKDLPRALQGFGRMMRKVRAMGREFQSGLDEIVRDAELQEARKSIESVRKGKLKGMVEESIDPDGEMNKELRDVDRTARQTANGTSGNDRMQDGKTTTSEKNETTKTADTAESAEASPELKSTSKSEAGDKTPASGGKAVSKNATKTGTQDKSPGRDGRAKAGSSAKSGNAPKQKKGAQGKTAASKASTGNSKSSSTQKAPGTQKASGRKSTATGGKSTSDKKQSDSQA